MMLSGVPGRVPKKSPGTVDARLGLARVLDALQVNELVERHTDARYTRELPSSTTLGVTFAVAPELNPRGGEEGRIDRWS
jgi:hypothetical protein